MRQTSRVFEINKVALFKHDCLFVLFDFNSSQNYRKGLELQFGYCLGYWLMWEAFDIEMTNDDQQQLDLNL